jgi:hypothetical protein
MSNCIANEFHRSPVTVETRQNTAAALIISIFPVLRFHSNCFEGFEDHPVIRVKIICDYTKLLRISLNR